MTENICKRYPRFFCENVSEEGGIVTGDDAKHISVVLRMRKGDIAVLCDGHGTDYLARITSSDSGCCEFKIIEQSPNTAEPGIYLRLFQAVPKSDKLDFIVQKAVECGASEIIPFFSARCVSRPEPKQMLKKTQRLQRIALEAAKQSGRGIIPKVGGAVDFSSLKSLISPGNMGIMFYENSTQPLPPIPPETRNIDIVVGSEGGFEEREAEELRNLGITHVSLGKRILRCETAPIAAISIIMHVTGNM